MTEKPNHIENVMVEFVKGIHKLEIFAGKVNEVAGPCEAGKTTLLDAIKMALAGARAQDPVPIMIGEEEGRIEVVTRDYEVVRVLRKGKADKFVVKGRAGGKFKQGDLSEMLPKLLFDPTEFLRWDRPKQEEVFSALAGKEWTAKLLAINTRLSDSRSERKGLRGEIDRKEGKLGRKPEVPEGLGLAELGELRSRAEAWAEVYRIEDAIKEHGADEPEKMAPVDVADVVERLAKAREHNAGVGVRAAARVDAQKVLDKCNNEVVRLQNLLDNAFADQSRAVQALDDLPEAGEGRRVEDMEKELAGAMEANEAAKEHAEWERRAMSLLEQKSAAADRAGDEPVTMEEVTAAEGTAKEIEDLRVAAATWEAAKKEIAGLEEEWEALGTKIGADERERDAHTQAATLPVKGMSLGPHGLEVEGVPFVQLNDGGKLEAACDIGISMMHRDDLRVMFIQRGESADRKVFQRIADKCNKADPIVQLWVATVDDTGYGHGGAIMLYEGRKMSAEEREAHNEAMRAEEEADA